MRKGFLVYEEISPLVWERFPPFFEGRFPRKGFSLYEERLPLNFEEKFPLWGNVSPHTLFFREGLLLYEEKFSSCLRKGFLLYEEMSTLVWGEISPFLWEGSSCGKGFFLYEKSFPLICGKVSSYMRKSFHIFYCAPNWHLQCTLILISGLPNLERPEGLGDAAQQALAHPRVGRQPLGVLWKVIENVVFLFILADFSS